MLTLFISLWWSVVVGFFNTVLRKRGYTYGGTPRKTIAFYVLATAITLALFAPMTLAWAFVDIYSLLALGGILFFAGVIDWEIAWSFPKNDWAWVWNSSLVKYADILFQQLMIFLLFVSVQGVLDSALEQILLFASIFTVLHLPVFVVMPRTIAWTFLIASICGGILFPFLYIYSTFTAPFIAFSVHVLFYSVLRAFEHHSDMWVHYLEQD